MPPRPLSQQTIDTVKATAPVLAEHGLNIVATMYRNLFREHPEVKTFFNPANQASGNAKTRASQTEAFNAQLFAPPGGQQLALAQAVFAYASNIDNLAALTPAVMRIANKHAALDIQPEHYPIVGKHLLGAIAEVLGSAATPAVLGAWGEAYGFLAEIFISIENNLRGDNLRKAGGWQGFRKFVVTRKVKESDNVCSFYLKPEDGGSVPPYRAGQYTGFRLEVPGAGKIYRNYSLSTAPGKDFFRVSIKREGGVRGFPDGVCSNYFHDHVHEGAVLDVAPPYGDFGLSDSTHPLVFLAGGVGITPLFSMFQHALEKNRTQPIHFIQCMQNGRLHPLKSEVQSLAAGRANVTVHNVYFEPESTDRHGHDYHSAGLLTGERLRQILPDNGREFYFTGPVGFMRVIRTALHHWGVPAERVHYECFGPHASEIEEDIA